MVQFIHISVCSYVYNVCSKVYTYVYISVDMVEFIHISVCSYVYSVVKCIFVHLQTTSPVGCLHCLVKTP